MTKQEVQNKAVEYIRTNRNLALLWATGVGKTRASIDIIKELSINNKEMNILLVVAEIAHKKNWEDEFIKWKLPINNITTECYASLKNYKNTNWDLIIFDEAHHLKSDIRIDIINTIKSKYVLLLSATLPDNIIQDISNIFGRFMVYKITLKEALDWKILPPPKLYLIPLELNNNNSIITIKWGKQSDKQLIQCKLHERWEYIKNRKKYPNTILEIQCTEQQKYDFLTDQYNYYKKQFLIKRQDHLKIKWLRAGLDRKIFLGECKTPYVKLLLNSLQDKRYICFCTNIKQSEELNKENSINSSINDSSRIIELFNTKQINHLFTVGMLQEGQNLVDINAGIIIQLDAGERAFLQKFGRSIRSDSPLQFIFYYKNTRDVDYLNNVFEGVDDKYIYHVDNIKDLII